MDGCVLYKVLYVGFTLLTTPHYYGYFPLGKGYFYKINCTYKLEIYFHLNENEGRREDEEKKISVL